MKMILRLSLAFVFFFLIVTTAFTANPSLSLKGYWVDKNTIALHSQFDWRARYKLCSSFDYSECFPLRNMGTFSPSLDENFNKQFAYLVWGSFLKLQVDLPEGVLSRLIKGPVIIVKENVGHDSEIFSVALTGLLDREFSYDGDDLGVTFPQDKVLFRLWAPTARSVSLKIYGSYSEDSLLQTYTLQEGSDHTWSLLGPSSLKNLYYKYEIETYRRRTGEYQKDLVSDLYSVNLSANGKFSQILDVLNDVKPTKWDFDTVKYSHPVNDFSDVAIYELHVRDFSLTDATQPLEHRGKFLAFTNSNANGVKHLSCLAKAGMTHLHLLPVNDQAMIEEISSKRSDFTPAEWQYLQSSPKASDRQQNLLIARRNVDGYNWGYDPVHYLALEGSYATDPETSARVLEYRKAIMAIHQMGLGVIQDVVFNHYMGKELESFVPDYYYSLRGDGEITMDSCCPDLASENKMVKKLSVDSALRLVRFYHLDGLRFDLMGFLTKSALTEIRLRLNKMTKESDGIDGKKVLLYGEGWNFGPLVGKVPNEAMTQEGAASLNMGIGSFNDRYRDAVKGKGQNTDELFRDDAFITDKTFARENVLSGLFGSLKGFKYGYVNQPYESINYLTAHDKNTLWDTLMAKIGPYSSTDQIVSIQKLAFSFLSYAQGIPFYHAGEEILRSKSGDENSYDSGDWFNRIDFSYRTNGWGSGLPPKTSVENEKAWPLWAPRLEKIPSPNFSQITSTFDAFLDALKIRFSSKLFHLSSRDDIFQKVTFPSSIFDENGNFFPQMIAMKIDDTLGIPVDKNFKKVWIIWNTSWDRYGYFQDFELGDGKAQLHPVLEQKRKNLLGGGSLYSDPTLLRIPPQSVWVYVLPKN